MGAQIAMLPQEMGKGDLIAMVRKQKKGKEGATRAVWPAEGKDADSALGAYTVR